MDMVCKYWMLLMCVVVISCDVSPWEQNGNMKRELARIYRSAEPGQYTHQNLQMSEFYLQQAAKAEPDEFLMFLYLHIRELLYAGKNTEAIVKIRRLLEEQDQSIDYMNMKSRQFWDLLAIAYMRKGEWENCIDHHSAASCVMPIEGDGIHSLREGSEKAIEIYSKILEQFPKDYQSKWLLNIAYMTLGEYPELVPEKFLIQGILSDSIPSDLSFVNVALGLGIDVNELSGGSCVEDFNNDGWLDIIASSYGLDDQISVFLNKGDGTFQDQTSQSGLAGIVSGLNMVHADYDNDGLADLLVLRGGWLGKEGTHPNSLLKNLGDGKFKDVTHETGLYSLKPTQTASWADINLDGWLDVFVGNEGGPEQDFPSELFVSNGDGTFTELAQSVGIQVNEYVKGVSWGDVNNDGYPDLYISILDGKNKLFVNMGGNTWDDWTFEEQSAQFQVSEPIHSFPTWFWDVNNDGWQDIFVVSYPPDRMFQVAWDEGMHYISRANDRTFPKLYINNRDGTFKDMTKAYGLQRPIYGMGSNFGDFDSDGYLDCYIGTGAPDLRSIVPNLAFRNHEGKWFQDITFSSGLGYIQKGHAVSFADIDNDGDQDIYTVLGGAVESDIFPNALMENPGNDNTWITLKLVGTKANRSAIGARVQVHTVSDSNQSHIFHHTVSTGGSFGSSSLQLEMGLGQTKMIDHIRILWPDKDNTVQIIQHVDVNQAYTIIQGEATPRKRAYTTFSFDRTPQMMMKHHQ